MTIKELYEWAKKRGIENCSILVKEEGGTKYEVEPVTIKYKSTADEHTEVELWKRRW